MKNLNLKAKGMSLAASALLACGCLNASAQDRPNIILIISDDHTWTHYGFMGHPEVQTPHLDRMADEGLLYTRGYVSPVCSPSLASLLTGLPPRRHGITGNDLQGRRNERAPLRHRLEQNSLMLPRALSEAGYLTFQTGKLWNASYQDIGFTHGMTAETSRHGGAGLTIGRNGNDPVYDFIDMAVAEEKPFFVWYAPLLPHDPHNPPERLLKKYRGKGPTPHGEVYHAMVEWLDEACGELDGWLGAKGLKENTVILYLADNGWDPERGYKGGRAKFTSYENGIRTPMFVRWPDKIKAQRDEKTLASILDFPKTILNLAGVEAPADLPGLDLRDRTALEKRKALLVASYTHDVIDLDDPTQSLTSKALIDGWWKLIVPGPNEEPIAWVARSGNADQDIQLYNLKNDPHETQNLAAEQPKKVAQLKARMQEVGCRSLMPNFPQN